MSEPGRHIRPDISLPTRLDYDVVIVGGGITGAGALLDASSRGMRTVLIEASDLASGTSQWSSKLIHGGLRYLESLEFSLVNEALQERATLLRIAPNLVRPLHFTIPILSGNSLVAFGRTLLYDATLTGYDLAGSRRSDVRHRRLSRGEVVSNLPTIRTESLHGGMLYPDAFVDDARYVLKVTQTAVDIFGADLLTYCHVDMVSRTDGTKRLRISHRVPNAAGPPVSFELTARSVIFSTGVRATEVAQASGIRPHMSITQAKGVHLAFPVSRLPVTEAAAIDVPRDGRRIFVVPWEGYTYLGTTDTPYYGDPSAPTVASSDVTYLLEAANLAFGGGLTEKDISGSWAGLRPLISSRRRKSTTKLSRSHEIEEVDPGIFIISGGKFTTYRRMAEEVVDRVATHIGNSSPSHTRTISIKGSADPGTARRLEDRARELLYLPGNAPKESFITTLTRRYGQQVTTVIERGVAEGGEVTEFESGAGIGAFEIETMITDEYATTLDDVLLRRSRLGILDLALAQRIAPAVGQKMGSVLRWEQARQSREIESFLARTLVAD